MQTIFVGLHWIDGPREISITRQKKLKLATQVCSTFYTVIGAIMVSQTLWSFKCIRQS